MTVVKHAQGFLYFVLYSSVSFALALALALALSLSLCLSLSLYLSLSCEQEKDERAAKIHEERGQENKGTGNKGTGGDRGHWGQGQGTRAAYLSVLLRVPLRVLEGVWGFRVHVPV